MSTITQEIAQRIIDEYVAGASTYQLGDKYGLWQTSICNLIAGRSWPGCRRPDNIAELIQLRKEKDRFQKGTVCHIDVPPFTSIQSDIIIGSLLGDGSILKPRSINTSFSKKQSKNRLSYLQWHYSLLIPYGSAVDKTFSREKLIGGKAGVILERQRVRKHHSGYVFRTHQHPNWTALRNEWYPKGQKVIPAKLKLNPQSIAVWYFDDGSNWAPHRQAIICTQCFTLEEADCLCRELSDFDLRPRITTVTSQYTGRKMPMLKFTKKSYDNLIHLVKPFMQWECFQHKIEWHRAKKQWEYSGKFTEEEAKKVIELRKTKSAREIAKIYNVHVNTIYALVSGRSWGHLQ